MLMGKRVIAAVLPAVMAPNISGICLLLATVVACIGLIPVCPAGN